MTQSVHIPEMMKALLLKSAGYSGTSEGPSIKSLEPYLEYGSIKVPEPDVGQLLIKVTQTAINPSDLHFIKGEYGLPRVKGTPAGFEGCGIVVKSGKGGEHLIGKRVGFIASGSGGWSEYALSDITSCVPVHDSVSDDDAAALFVNPLTAIAMIEEVKASQSPSFILSAASSQLCKLMIGLAKEDGLKAIALVRRDEQMGHLTDLGAHKVFNVQHKDFMSDMLATLRDEKPRVFLDAVADQMSSDIFAAMPNRAEWVIYGKLSTTMPTLNQAGQFIFMDKKIRGFWLTKWLREQDAETRMNAGKKVQQWFATGKWKTDIHAKVYLSQAHQQLPKLLAMANTGKIMLVPDAD